ncbi:hypothetical protein PAXRUDRAFT_22318 [Paxillus rubicundulus Ve08.2h10]|uniref:Uncharacterized protein n=1 Tax=Paxillus rubicundulus Ve08.2h10 TaxID=930991 RepID=A0A0D0CXN3_9AGAM|nr:hypothetical protein PAXRUDRAFT_22318 [Paxillus rubicundulus Ve08.2h10]
MSHHFPDQTGFQQILEYIGLRCDFICWAAVSDTMDHSQCLGNLPSEIALATRVIAMVVMQGWKVEIPHTIRLLVDPEHTVASHINRDYAKITEDPGLLHPWWSDVTQQLLERYQELGWEELLSLYAEFIPRCPMLVLPPEIPTTGDLTEIGRQAVLTWTALAREITEVDVEMRAAMERIVELEAFWPAEEIFDALSGHHDDRSRWPFM